MMYKRVTLYNTMPFNASSLISLVALLFMLSACNQLPVKNTLADNQNLYEQRWPLLQSIEKWRIQGKISITKNGKNNSASLRWLHSPDTYQLSIIGPFGQGKLTIEGNPYQVFAIIDGRNVFANNLNELFSINLGWPVPAEQFQYWVRGIVSPKNLTPNSQYTINKQGHVTSFKQQNWTVTLAKYQSFTGLLTHLKTDKAVWLPTKVTLTDNNMKVKIIIKQWQPLPENPFG